MSSEKIIALEGRAKDREEAIRLCGQALCDADVVRAGFAEGCVRREREHATGICSDIPVAIPHCKSEDILRSGVCYLRLEEPVEFQRMDDDYETIMTRSIFNLAIQDGGDHLDFLQKMMAVVGDEAFMQSLEQADIRAAPSMLAERLAAAAEG